MTNHTFTASGHCTTHAMYCTPQHELSVGDTVMVRSTTDELDQRGTITKVSADRRIFGVTYSTGWAVLTGPARLTRI